ncbi:MAG: DEAD/DEAH box helicase [Candidatus Anammoxibacter sp.]
MDFKQFKLARRLQEGISCAGYEVPTPIQEAAIPLALEGRDIIGTAQTGTGKTAAFVLPMLSKLINEPRNKCHALIVTPTRELAEQIHMAIQVLGTGTKIRSATIYGGVDAAPQIKALRAGVEILVACPGRLLDHLEKKHANFDTIKMLVLDEADRMFDMGFLPSIRRILEQLPSNRQTLLFSATFPPEIEKLGAQTLTNPERISVDKSAPAYTVQHALYPVRQHLKTALLKMLLKQTKKESVLIFTRTKHRAKQLARKVTLFGYKTTSLHGNRTQGQRQTAINGFKDKKFQIMVATDVAARGLDVESISHVINFDMPDTEDAYIHRIGRTGRAQRKGDAFTLVTSQDKTMILALEKMMGRKLDRNVLKDFDYTAPADPGPRLHHGNDSRTSNNDSKPGGGGYKGASSKTAQKEKRNENRYKSRNSTRRTGGTSGTKNRRSKNEGDTGSNGKSRYAKGRKPKS